MEIVLATGNLHKIAEIQSILSDVPVAWRSARDWPNMTEVSEEADTYQGNALLKASGWCRHTGLWALSDDSGLEVDALDGRPGIHSARYADSPKQRIDRLLAEMERVPDDKRTARFVCVAVLVGPAGQQHATRGVLEGRIAHEPRGNGGFGFDPIFIPNGCAPSHLAEMTADAKNRISHRALAMREMGGVIERLRKTV